jgi:hypothetical protein
VSNQVSHPHQTTSNIIVLTLDLIMNGQVFEGVQNFRYLGSLKTLKNIISD